MRCFLPPSDIYGADLQFLVVSASQCSSFKSIRFSDDVLFLSSLPSISRLSLNSVACDTSPVLFAFSDVVIGQEGSRCITVANALLRDQIEPARQRRQQTAGDLLSRSHCQRCTIRKRDERCRSPTALCLRSQKTDKESLESVLSSYVKACGKQSVKEILAERDVRPAVRSRSMQRSSR